MRAVRDRLALPLIGILSLVIVLLVGYLLLGHAPGRGGRTDVTALPTLNALLNGACAVFLTAGWVFIRRRRIAAHRICMLAAFALSTLFLISYVVYHALAGSRPFTGQGPIRWIYFPLLVSHIVLAAAMVPFVHDALPCAGSRVCPPRAAGPADAAGVAVRLGHRRRRLLDALPPVPVVQAPGSVVFRDLPPLPARNEG
jgi:putative membrane protein